MRNKLLEQLRRYDMVRPGDRVICAVSGGADSMALLWAMYLLKEKLQISLEAAHFNHNLRGAESDRDAAFVEDFCRSHGIRCHVGSARVKPGEKGLEAAAREARYAYLQSLPGKIATAHTADDNAETLLMHLVRGTGLKGLGGIAPVRENVIRPMLTVTRQEVLAFLEEQGVACIHDSSNDADAFLRNRIRHHVMPLLKAENPSLTENLSAAAMRLRLDEEALDSCAQVSTDVPTLCAMPPAIQARALAKLLQRFGIKEPTSEHIALLRRVVHSESPSARAVFAPDVCIGRQYDELVLLKKEQSLSEYVLKCPGETEIPELGISIFCQAVSDATQSADFLVNTRGRLVLRSRRAGDTITLSGGTRSLKKLLIDKKIPAAQRDRIPVIADEAGIVAVVGIGPDRDRCKEPNTKITVSYQPMADK